MRESRNVTTNTGLARGTIILRKIMRWLAPSIFAASSISLGMVSKKPFNIHVFTPSAAPPKMRIRGSWCPSPRNRKVFPKVLMIRNSVVAARSCGNICTIKIVESVIRRPLNLWRLNEYAARAPIKVCIAAAEKATTKEFLAQIKNGFSELEKSCVKLANPWCTGMSCCVLSCPVTSKAAEIIHINGKSENRATTTPIA